MITLEQVQKNISEIANRDSYSRDFVFDLMLAYGRSRSSVTQLRQGINNMSSDPNAVLQKDVIYFKVYPVGYNLVDAIEELERDPLTKSKSPRYLIVTDLNEMVAKDTKKSTATALAIKIKDIDRETSYFYGLTGGEIDDSSKYSESALDRRSADKMKTLYDEIEKENKLEFIKPGNTFRHDLNVFFTRLLFCFFAEDTGLFGEKQFTELLKLSCDDGSDLDWFFETLFISLDTDNKDGIPDPFDKFPYVNGTIFNTHKHGIAIPKFNAQARHLIMECASLNWAHINPDIFGTIFQGIVDTGRRDENGMDYTSVPNILKVIEPLFLNDLREEYTKSENSQKMLYELWDRISEIKIFDPACGSGNFLIISYKKLRELEDDIITRIDELIPTGIGVRLSSRIKLNHFYGIEIDDFARELAVLSMHIAAHQMNIEFKKKFGKELSIIPITDMPTIVCGNAARINWNNVCPNKPHETKVVNKIEQANIFGSDERAQSSLKTVKYDEIYLIGNPPYKGSKLQSKSQKEDFKQYFANEDYSKNLDYIAIWFIKGSRYLKRTRAKLAFVSTNSICQGEHISAMFPKIYEIGVDIDFAYNSFKWRNSAKNNAGVTVIILALSDISVCAKRKLFHSDGTIEELEKISPNLGDGSQNIVEKRNNPQNGFPKMLFGSQALDGGNLILDEQERLKLLELNPAAGIYIKKFLGSEECIRGKKRYCLWIDKSSLEDARKNQEILKRINATKEFRAKQKSKSTRDKSSTPYSFCSIRYNGRPSLVIPRVSSEKREYIPMCEVDGNTVVPDSALFIENCPFWLFALLESKMHMAWIRTVCGKLKTDYRYSSTLGYNTFPVPPLSPQAKNKLDESAKKILLAREMHVEMTLGDMYDPDKMPADLRAAHDENDLIVDHLYRQSGFRTDEDRLAKLFEMYEEMTKI